MTRLLQQPPVERVAPRFRDVGAGDGAVPPQHVPIDVDLGRGTLWVLEPRVLLQPGVRHHHDGRSFHASTVACRVRQHHRHRAAAAHPGGAVARDGRSNSRVVRDPRVVRHAGVIRHTGVVRSGDHEVVQAHPLDPLDPLAPQVRQQLRRVHLLGLGAELHGDTRRLQQDGGLHLLAADPQFPALDGDAQFLGRLGNPSKQGG